MLPISKHPKFELGKFLSWILRHGASQERIPINADGFIPVEYILNHKTIKGKYNKDDILHVVETDKKGRFTVIYKQNSFDIRANQGHSISAVTELELLPIIDTTDFKFVIHGTFLKKWNQIKSEGLHRMKRNHIHFVHNLQGTVGGISGLRSNAEIYIYINLGLALENGLKFFLSTNGVILSPGDQEGYIKPKFFLKVTFPDSTFLEF